MTKEVNFAANDDTPEALALAAENWKLLIGDWCYCKGSEGFENAAYYRDPKSGSHGWMCGHCKHIIQTG